jgi:hypothetical protein
VAHSAVPRPNGEVVAAWPKVGGDSLVGLRGLQRPRSDLGRCKAFG